jgi:hypothetical protein
MKLKLLTIIILMFGINSLTGQTVIKNSDQVDFQKGIGLETFYQSNYGVGIGGIIGNNYGDKNKANYFVGIYTDLYFTKSPIFGPRLKINYNYLGIFGVNLNFSNLYREGVNDFRITPEVNFSVFGHMNLFIGYSFNVSKNNFSEVDKYKLGISLNLVNSKK